ncbi:MAG: hypothetical protein R2728_15240 [Chitinophagales bacterium]
MKKANENIKSAEENKTVLATNIETSSSKPEVKTNKEVKTLSLEAFKIKKLALFQSIGEASESNKDNLVEINGIGPLIEAKLNINRHL